MSPWAHIHTMLFIQELGLKDEPSKPRPPLQLSLFEKQETSFEVSVLIRGNGLLRGNGPVKVLEDDI